MNHKRGRARNRRAGCKLCKPWKVNGFRTERVEGEKWSDHVRREAMREECEAASCIMASSETGSFTSAVDSV